MKMSGAFVVALMACAAQFCAAHEPKDADHRHWDTFAIEGGQPLALPCGLTVPAIANGRGYPKESARIRRFDPQEDDRSDALDLWRAGQFVARWRDPNTNWVTILEMAYPFPRAFKPGQYVRADDYYREAQEAIAAGYTNIAPADVKEWIKAYYHQCTGTSDVMPVVLWQEVFQDGYRYLLKEGESQRLVYAMHMRKSGLPVPGPDVCYVMEFKGVTEIGGEHERTAEQFLGLMRFDAQAHATWRANFAKQEFMSHPHAHAVRGVVNLADEWKDFKFRRFALLTNREECFGPAVEGLEYLHGIYRLFPTILPPFGPSLDDPVCTLRIYRSFWEFEDNMGSRRWAGGAYCGSDEVIMRNWWNGTAVHECFHRYMDLSTGRGGASTWFNEGFATYVGGCKVVDGRLAGQPVDSGHLLIGMMKKGETWTVSQVFTVADFYEDKANELNPKDKHAALRRAKNYTSSWGIIYFLREASSLYPGKGYEAIIPLYWETLRKTGDEGKATKAALQKLPMNSFLYDFREYFLGFEELFRNKEKGKRSTEPKCDCEYCQFLHANGLPYPEEFSLNGESAPTTSIEETRIVERRPSRSSPTAESRPVQSSRVEETSEEDASGQSMTMPIVLIGAGVIIILVLGIRYYRGGLFVLLLALLPVGHLFGASATTNGYTFVYRVSGNDAEIYNGGACAVAPRPEGRLSIPETLGGYPVKAIGVAAFDRCINLSSVVIPGSVTVIHAYAFAECPNLTSVRLPSSLMTIGDCAFYGCYKLEDIALPESVGIVGKGAFYQCHSLKGVAIPANVKVIGDRTFERCFKMYWLRMGESVRVIGNDAFSGCTSLPGVTLPKNAAMIGDRAFKWCSSLRDVTVPGSIGTIGSEVFAGCSSLSYVSVTGGVTSIGRGAFKWCSSLEWMMIPDSVTTIADEAFYGCRRMTSLRMSAFATNVGNYAFYGCHGLTDVVIGQNVNSIGNHAFDECYGLKTVTIPPSVFSIGRSAFSRCGSLVSVTIPASVVAVEENVFRECASLASVAIPASVGAIRAGAFENCTGLISIELPDSVSSIGESAFSGCRKLETIRLGNGISEIGKAAFSGCRGLGEIWIPGAVNDLGTKAFENCGKLRSVHYAGNAPATVGAAIYAGTPEVMRTLVVPESRGWGDKVPGIWNERAIQHQSSKVAPE